MSGRCVYTDKVSKPYSGQATDRTTYSRERVA